MSDQPKVPFIDPSLIAALEHRFPLECPKENWSNRHIWIMAGTRHVLDFLKAEHQQQEEQ